MNTDERLREACNNFSEVLSQHECEAARVEAAEQRAERLAAALRGER